MSTISDETATDLEFLAKISATCPSWCIDEHAEAYREGCDVETGAEHMGRGPEVRLYEVRNPYTGRVEREARGGWQARLRQTPYLHNAGHLTEDEPLVEFGVDEHAPHGEGRSGGSAFLKLTTGEARTLAAALLRLAEEGERG